MVYMYRISQKEGRIKDYGCSVSIFIPTGENDSNIPAWLLASEQCRLPMLDQSSPRESVVSKHPDVVREPKEDGTAPLL